MSVTIFSVDHDSPAEHAGILPGETLCSINGNEICDILDYRFYETEKEVLLLLRDAQGADREIKLRKGQLVGDASTLDLEDQGKGLIDYVKETYHYRADRVSKALDELTGKEEGSS